MYIILGPAQNNMSTDICTTPSVLNNKPESVPRPFITSLPSYLLIFLKLTLQKYKYKLFFQGDKRLQKYYYIKNYKRLSLFNHIFCPSHSVR